MTMAKPTNNSRPRFAIEVQPFTGAPWRDEGLRIEAIDHESAMVIARRECPNAAGIWANLLRPPYIAGIGHRVVSA